MPEIHPTSMVGPECELAGDARVGPYCVLTGAVRLGPGVRLLGNVYLNGPVTIGAGTIVYPFACVGYEPQDYKFGPGQRSAGVVVGERCIIREHATVHSASNEQTPTRIGDRVFMMVGSHVAHDCTIGNDVVMVNGAAAGGHATVGDRAVLGGNAMIHQHCRIGRLVMMSGDCAVTLDVPPFCMVHERNRVGGLNLVGLRRGGIPRAQISLLSKAFREVLRRPVPRDVAVARLRELGAECPPAVELAEFIESSVRGIVPGMGKAPRGSRTAAATAAELQEQAP
ncbi:MAG TPA: acyl-ACP--UDP-N-acetylglucosamine O-acyltransferase [Phycisphaerales bacterium]|nr:acyl-ACP--UDP-N-acetylglucosamine O-acyltransferase [Phycisphaerales bacterium]